MKTSITILNTDFEVEYIINITSRGCSAHYGSLIYEGHPADAAEFEVEFLALYKDKIELTVPDWLKELILEHLYNRKDINEIAQEIDYERGCDD